MKDKFWVEINNQSGAFQMLHFDYEWQRTRFIEVLNAKTEYHGLIAFSREFYD